ncbi:hypothetical protein SDC9_169247 [bioreactor metagenome]|uniref:Uncharacterized protein n=1 Tax=bioreactor metagenome TaxID=1076179 RepID=A0A645G5E4_9ZZZZ
MGGYLHGAMGAAGLHHFGKVALQQHGVRCRDVGLHCTGTGVDFYGSDKPALAAGRVDDVFEQEGRRSFSVRAGNPHHGELIGGPAIPAGCDEGIGCPGIGDDDAVFPAGLFGHNACGSRLHGLRDVFVAVGFCTADGNEEHTGLHDSAVGRDACDFTCRIGRHPRRRNAFK